MSYARALKSCSKYMHSTQTIFIQSSEFALKKIHSHCEKTFLAVIVNFCIIIQRKFNKGILDHNKGFLSSISAIIRLSSRETESMIIHQMGKIPSLPVSQGGMEFIPTKICTVEKSQMITSTTIALVGFLSTGFLVFLGV